MERADAKAEEAVHQLLSPRLTAILEHPSWMIGAGGVLKKPVPIRKADGWTDLLGVRPKKCEAMHDLRKAVREVRYIVESVESIYQGKEHSELRKATDMLVARQKVLGDVHDLEVLVEYSMANKNKVPSVLSYLQTCYHAQWDRWTTLEKTEPLLTKEARSFLENAIIGVLLVHSAA